METVGDESSSVKNGSSASADSANATPSPASAPSVSEPDAEFTDEDPTGGAPLSDFERLVQAIARDYAPVTQVDVRSPQEAPSGPLGPVSITADQAAQPAMPSIWVSIAMQFSTICIAVMIMVSQLAAFLNALGTATQEAGFCDVQIWLQRRRGKKAGDRAEIWGLVVDIDVQSPDPVGSFVDAGLPFPTCFWPTRHGYKGCWAFSCSVDTNMFVAIAQQFTISVPGGDPKSWSPEQGQHLPYVNKSTLDGNVPVKFTAVQTNPQPLQVDDFVPKLPMRLERALSGGERLDAGERKIVEDYLDDQGTPAPDEAGGRSGPYDHCPVAEQHDRPCFYVYRQEDESVDATCLGGHGGELVKRWSEPALFELATGRRRADAGISPLHDIPITWAGDEYLKQRFSITFASEPATDESVASAIAVWMRARASRVLMIANQLATSIGAQNTNAIALDRMVSFYQKKIKGFDLTGPCRVCLDSTTKTLRILRSDGSTESIKAKGETLTLGPHLHEWKASSAYDIRPKVTSDKKTGAKRLVFEYGFDVDENTSHWNKAMNGSSVHLAALGIPVLHNFALPIAFKKDDCTIDLSTKCLHIIRTAQMREADPKFDALDFLTNLQRKGMIPLATEQDVPRYLMAMASPLVRDIAPGLLGVYVFEGPSGSGKEYLIVTIHDTWENSILIPATVSFEIHDVDDLEQNRNFHAAANSAVYLRAIEAGKSIEKINALIRYSTTKYVTARGMQIDPRQVLNRFTYFADTVEGLPERKEISRRTAIIGTRNIDPAVSKGEVRQKIVENAASIITYLKTKVESQPREWFLNQSHTQSRQVAQAALAKLFGAQLHEVASGNTEELFEHMLTYSKDHGQEEGKRQLAQGKQRGGKDGKEVALFPSYDVNHLIDSMKGQVGAQQFFKQHATTRSIEMFLKREANYHEVEINQAHYLRVVIDGTAYAFKLVKGKRNFVLEEELVFCDKLGIEPIGPPQKKKTEETSSDTESQAPIEPTTARPKAAEDHQRRGPIKISAAKLRSDDQRAQVANDAASKRK